jgi:hypothetical protein
MTLAGTGIVGIVTPVHELVKHLYHSACGNIDDSHVLALTGLQKIQIVAEGMPAQAYLKEHFEINHASRLSDNLLLLSTTNLFCVSSAYVGSKKCLGMKSNPWVLWFCFG